MRQPALNAIPVSEAEIHAGIVALWRVAGRRDVIMFHPANEDADTRSKRFRGKRQGIWAGAPDLIFIPPPGESTAFIELKSRTGKVSVNQRVARARIESAGHRYRLIRSIDDAAATLTEWRLLRVGVSTGTAA